MPRATPFSPVLLATLAACQSDPGRYTSASLRLEANAVNVHLRGSRTHGDSRHPCAPTVQARVLVNGIPMDAYETGGYETVPDSDEQYCLHPHYTLDLKLLPADTERLEITFEGPDAQDWGLSADWPHTVVWTEGDLAHSMRMHEEFVLRWEPADEPTPTLFPVAFDNRGHWRNAAGWTVERVDSEPGRARFRFGGPEPGTLWNVSAHRNGSLENTACSGFDDCDFRAGGDTVSLHPVGIPPESPEGVAPPRECITAPGVDGWSYDAPSWVDLPDLSTVHVGPNVECDGADLYFVLLGACGVCGGGKSTFVVANRGTQAASFSVRSNAQTIEGETLQPGEASAPLEISFADSSSQIEILTDDDCDASSNAAWVASVACPGYVSPSSRRYDCNNTCRE